MSIRKRVKLNHLLSEWQTNGIMTSRYLGQLGYSPQLLQRYCKSQWIRMLNKGAYCRLNESPSWEAGVFALQTQLQLSLHVGGLSALQYFGLSHNVPFTITSGHLYNTFGKKLLLPRWYLVTFPDSHYYGSHLFDTDIGVTKKNVDQFKLALSTPERAILEVLALVPHAYDYEDAENLVENLQLARPELFQTLLEQCLSVKVKRLFLYLAEQHLPFFNEFNFKTINLGAGSRSIAPGGKYIPAYNLTIPKLAYRDQNEREHV